MLAFFIGCGVLAFLFGPWIWLWRSHLKHKRIREQDQQRWKALTERIFHVEGALQDLQKAAPGPPGKAAAETAAVTIVPSVARFIPPPPPPVVAPVPAPPAIEPVAVEPTPERAAAEAWISEPRGEEPPPRSLLLLFCKPRQDPQPALSRHPCRHISARSNPARPSLPD